MQNSKNEKELESQTAVERVRKCTFTPCDVFVITMAFTIYTIAIVYFFLTYPGFFNRPTWWDERNWSGRYPEQHLYQFFYLSTLGSLVVCIIFLIIFYCALAATGRLVPSSSTRHRTKLLFIRLALPIVFCALLLLCVIPSLVVIVCGSEKMVNCNCWVINGEVFYAEGCDPSRFLRENKVCKDGRVSDEKSLAITIVMWVGLGLGWYLSLLHSLHIYKNQSEYVTKCNSFFASLKEGFEKVYAIDD